MWRMKIATVTVCRFGFSDQRERLRLLENAVYGAAREKCSFAVFPGGFLCIPPDDSARLKNQVREIVQRIGVPSVIGVDYSTKEKSGYESIKSLLTQKKRGMRSFSKGARARP